MSSQVITQIKSLLKTRCLLNLTFSALSKQKIFFSQRTFTTSIIMSNSESKSTGDDACKIKMSEEEWKKKLTAEQYRVCRQKGTELPFTGEYNHHKKDGTYTCVCCGASLFSSDTKYDSECGWPAFHTALGANDGDETDANVSRLPDNSLGRHRTEVMCKQCHAHLGHVFEDGPQPTGERFCINSVSLNFKPSKK